MYLPADNRRDSRQLPGIRYIRRLITLGRWTAAIVYYSCATRAYVYTGAPWLGNARYRASTFRYCFFNTCRFIRSFTVIDLTRNDIPLRYAYLQIDFHRCRINNYYRTWETRVYTTHTRAHTHADANIHVARSADDTRGIISGNRNATTQAATLFSRRRVRRYKLTLFIDTVIEQDHRWPPGQPRRLYVCVL